jgi:hypothetical protein
MACSLHLPFTGLPLCDLSLEPREFLALRCELGFLSGLLGPYGDPGFQSGLATWRGIFLAVDSSSAS